jgi:chromosome partitioning protein
MATIISLVALKGGAGKSTLAVNIASYFSSVCKVGLIDADLPQASSAVWASLRGEDEGLEVRTASTAKELIQAAKELNASCKYVVIDTPPRMAELTQIALKLADISLTPLGASALELWSLQDLRGVLENTRLTNPSRQDRAVWMRIRHGSNVVRELMDADLEKSLGIKPLETVIHNRAAYVSAVGTGAGVWELSDKLAKEEIRSLCKEVNAL